MASSKLSLGGPITLRDVARVAGVHPGTVSRALNPETRGLVNERTAQRVLDAAKELGYRPNPIARGLRTNRSHTIGVLVPDLMNPLFAAVVRGIEDGLRDGGYTPLIANTDNDPERERVAFEAMNARQVDGFIAATATRDHWLLADAVALGAKVVLVNRRVDSDALPAVTGDDHEGIRLAVEHLVGLGHRRIAHLAGSQSLYTGWSRHQGFVDAMRVRARARSRAGRVQRDVHRARRARAAAASCSTAAATSPRSWPATTCSRSAATTRSKRAACAARMTCRSSATTTCRSSTGSNRRSPRFGSRTTSSARPRHT